MSDRDAFLQRLDAVEARLAALAAAHIGSDVLTARDPASGERWEAGQIWAHLAEFVPYWMGQADAILRGAGSGEPVPFGRTKSDAGRLEAIERDRVQPVPVLWSDTRQDIEALRGFLNHLDPGGWEARGVHPTRGVMTVERLLDEFAVSHLEEHADQLADLEQTRRRGTGDV